MKVGQDGEGWPGRGRSPKQLGRRHLSLCRRRKFGMLTVRLCRRTQVCRAGDKRVAVPQNPGRLTVLNKEGGASAPDIGRTSAGGSASRRMKTGRCHDEPTTGRPRTMYLEKIKDQTGRRTLVTGVVAARASDWILRGEKRSRRKAGAKVSLPIGTRRLPKERPTPPSRRRP